MHTEPSMRRPIDSQSVHSNLFLSIASHLCLPSTYVKSPLYICIQVELLLSAADEGVGDKLREYAAEQAAGEQLNAVAEAYSNPNAGPGSQRPHCPMQL